MVGRIGQYDIIRELGSGQFGTVYLGVGEVPIHQGRRRVQKKVAVKVLRDPGNPSAQASLAREFQLMDQVRHRSLCRFYEYLDKEAAVVMEWIQGVDLRKVLDEMENRNERVSVEAIVAIGCELADCLFQSFATPSKDGTSLNLVHRDMKPENIMITPDGEVKILDFGLARVRNPGKPRDRMVMGTPLYMAPEQAMGRLVDHRTDLFAVGLILYELLMGEPAYEINDSVSDPEAEVMGRIETGNLAPEIQRVQGRYPTIGPIIGRCLQPNPRSRYGDGHELMVELRGQIPRERGVYLKQFCDYFFSMIHPVLPDDTIGDDSERADQSAVRDRQPTERRTEQMSDPKRPPRPSAKPPRPGGGGGPRRPSAAAPSSAGRPPPGPRSSRPTGPRQSRQPSGGGPAPRRASAPTPPPQKKKPRFGLGESSARSPNQTGMLQMVPLTDDDEEDEAVPSSATQFFAIPKSRTKKKKKPASSAPRLGVSGSMGGGAPGTAPRIPAAGGPPPMGGVPAISGPSGPMGGGMAGGAAPGRPMGGMGIQGPVASGPVAQGAASPSQPFANTAEQHHAPDTSGSRARSLKVVAILGVLMVTALFTLLLAAVGVFIVINQNPGASSSSSSGSSLVSSNSSTEEEDDEEEYEDEDGDEEDYRDELRQKEEKRKRRRRTSSSSNRSSNNSSAAPVVSKPKAPKKPSPITVNITSGKVSKVKINCDDGTRSQISGGSGKSTPLSPSTSCKLTFSSVGGVPTSWKGAKPGRSYSCSVSSAGASCK